MLFLHAGLGRSLGQAGLGGYSTAIAISVYFLFIVDCGLGPRIVREGAVAPELLQEEYARAMGLKLVSGLFACALIAILYFVLPYDSAVRKLCIWLSLGAVIRSFTYLNESVFRARERFDLEGALQLLYAAVYVGAALGCLLLDYAIEFIGIAAVLVAVLQFLVSAVWLRKFVRFALRWPPHLQTLSAAVPYAATSLTITAFAQIDILMLSMISTQEIVGSYTAVSRLLLVVGTMSGLAVTAILPAASRIYSTSTPERYRSVVNEALRFTLHLGGAATIGAVGASPHLLGWIYGPEFQSLYPLLQLGSVYLVVRFLNSILEALLTSCGRQVVRARALIFGFIATVVLVFGLVPFWGVFGAVLAMLLSECVLLCCLTLAMRDFFSEELLRSAACRFLLAIGGAAAVYFSLFSEGMAFLYSALTALLAIVTYLAVLIFSGEAKRVLHFLGVARMRS